MGPEELGMPHIKPLKKGLFEIRARSDEGIARAPFCIVKNKVVIVLSEFIKKTQETPLREIKKALTAYGRGKKMTNKRPSFETFKKKALLNKEVKAEYDLLEPEFSLLEKFIKARKKARYTQSELAKLLNIQQPVIARLEKGGYSATSINKLAKIADVMGYSLKVSLSPKKIN